MATNHFSSSTSIKLLGIKYRIQSVNSTKNKYIQLNIAIEIKMKLTFGWHWIISID